MSRGFLHLFLAAFFMAGPFSALPALAQTRMEQEEQTKPPEQLPAELGRNWEEQPWPIRLMVQPTSNGMLIRLPVVDTDPNRGVTYGVMPVWVIKDKENDRIRAIHAPSFTYNKIFKAIPTYRYFLYPTSLSSLVARASLSQVADREVLVEYEDLNFLDKGLVIAGLVQYNMDGAGRFFGIGPNSSRQDETNFTRYTTQYYVRLGLPVFPGSGWKFNLQHHMAGERLADGPIDTLANLGQRFPDQEPKHTHQNAELQLFMDYDTRDGAVATTHGSYAKIFIENAQHALGSEFSFQQYGLDLRHFYKASPDSRFVTAGNLRYQQLIGDAPFYLEPQLGGKYIFRGYGTGRYVDRGLIVANAEKRITMFKIPTAGVMTEYELAPFAGLGTVFSSPGHMAGRYARPVFGAAVRAIARPQVVGSIDFGIGQEGLKIFMDINYSF